MANKPATTPTIENLRKAGQTLSWLAVQFRDRANDDGEPTSIGDAEQVEAALAAVTAAVVELEAAIAELEEDDNPFHHESPEGRAWDRPDSDWIAVAKDAGYDGSPGGEKEWCLGNGIWPR